MNSFPCPPRPPARSVGGKIQQSAIKAISSKARRWPSQLRYTRRADTVPYRTPVMHGHHAAFTPALNSHARGEGGEACSVLCPVTPLSGTACVDRKDILDGSTALHSTSPHYTAWKTKTKGKKGSKNDTLPGDHTTTHLAALAPSVTGTQVRASDRRLAAVGHPAPLAPAVRRAEEAVASALVAALVGAPPPPPVRDAQPSVALGQLVAAVVLALPRGAPVVPAERRTAVRDVPAPGGTAQEGGGGHPAGLVLLCGGRGRGWGSGGGGG